MSLYTPKLEEQVYIPELEEQICLLTLKEQNELKSQLGGMISAEMPIYRIGEPLENYHTRSHLKNKNNFKTVQILNNPKELYQGRKILKSVSPNGSQAILDFYSRVIDFWNPQDVPRSLSDDFRMADIVVRRLEKDLERFFDENSNWKKVSSYKSPVYFSNPYNLVKEQLEQ